MPAPSFSLAPGDPDALFAAADWHDGVASGLYEHAGTIRASAGSALAFWQGEAATAYQGLASAMAFGFESASNQSAQAAGIYRQVAREVDRCQQEGRVALAHAEHCCEEITADSQRVVTAQAAVAEAQQEIESAAKVVALSARTPGANVAAAQAQVSAAQDRLHQAQGQLQTAQQDLEHAQQELTRWDRRGQELYEEAALAVEQVTGLPMSITPPPMPGAITGPISPLSATPPALQPHGPGFWGRLLDGVEVAASAASGYGGLCASTLFWVPFVGEGCGVVAAGGDVISGGIAVGKLAAGKESLGQTAVELVGVAGAAGGLKLEAEGSRLLEDGHGIKGAAGAILRNKGYTYKAVSGGLDGASAAWSVHGAADHHGS